MNLYGHALQASTTAAAGKLEQALGLAGELPVRTAAARRGSGATDRRRPPWSRRRGPGRGAAPVSAPAGRR